MLRRLILLALLGILGTLGLVAPASGIEKCKLSDCHSSESSEGDLFIIRAHGSAEPVEVDLQTAMDHFKRYRWVHVNSSCKNLAKAKGQMRAISEALGAPTRMPGVLLYLSRGIGGDRNHDIVTNRLKTLVEHLPREDKPMLVTSKSYAHHVVLSALKDYRDDRILHISISPAFGAFGGPLNDRGKVEQYIQDIRDTRTPYCMIASNADNYTQNAGGAAWQSGRRIEGDSDVYDAIQANSSRVSVFLLPDAEHCPVAFYINAGLVDAMQRCSSHFDFDGTFVDDVLHGRELSWLVPIIGSY